MKFQILLKLPKDRQLFVVRPEIRASHWFSDIKKAVTRDHDEVCVDARAVNRKYVLSVALAFFRHHFVMSKYKTDAASKANRIVLVVKEREDLVEIKRRLKAQWFGNRLASEPANKLHPARFCRVVQDYFAGAGAGARVKVRVLDRAELKRQGFGLVLAVGDSSRAHPPHFLIVQVGGGGGRGKRTICAVGKGVVFDSGGYDLKSSAGMLGMKGDKTGGGVAVALARYFGVEAPERLPKDTRLVVLVPLVENMIGQHAQRVGDVHTAWNGKTVEVLNTDAEGRLILADALAYASRVYKPALLVDFATLTGWAGTLHCDTSYVYYTENDRLAAAVEAGGRAVGERSIRMPAWPEYKEDTRSEIADYKNAYFKTCEKGGGFMAAMFLANFVSDAKNWIHFDLTHVQNPQGMSTCHGLQTAIELISGF